MVASSAEISVVLTVVKLADAKAGSMVGHSVGPMAVMLAAEKGVVWAAPLEIVTVDAWAV